MRACMRALPQGGDMYGTTPGPVSPADMTHACWDYVLLGGPMPADCKVAAPLMERMRTEFEFW